MIGRVLLDTNLLVHTYDLDARKRHAVARQLVASLWDERAGVLSVQVLQEFYVVATRKMETPMTPLDARSALRPHLQSVVDTDAGMVLMTSETKERNRITTVPTLIL
jgi:predicted nucleic acid-binding protein